LSSATAGMTLNPSIKAEIASILPRTRAEGLQIDKLFKSMLFM